jgi:putative chitinase
MSTPSIKTSVGHGGVNNTADVETIQELLNAYKPCRPDPILVEDGIIGDRTIAAIKAVQEQLGMAHPDGRIDPGGRTFMEISGDFGEEDTAEEVHGADISAANSFTVEDLRAIMPNLKQQKADDYFPHLHKAMGEFGINENRLRQAAFLAQVAHESGEFRYMREIWGPTKAQKGYEGREDLGNTHPGDGKRYMGRGPIQITGRANYKRYGDLLDLPLVANPELAETPEVAFRVAGAFWKTHGLNELADKQMFKTITKRINGGYNGLDDRVKYYGRAKKVLAV